MVTVVSPQSQANDNDQRRRKQTLERAKANHLSRQLQMRLQYARLKVEHGWQRQNLNEVENLYFHHSVVGRNGTITYTNNPRASTSKVGHLAAPPVMMFQPTGDGGGGFGGGSGMRGTGVGTDIGMTMSTGEGMGTGKAMHDKDVPGIYVFPSGGEGEGGNVNVSVGSDVGQREGMGGGMGMESRNGMAMDGGDDTGRVENDDDSQLDPRILMESAMTGGAGSADLVQQQELDISQAQSLSQVHVASPNQHSTSTSPWLVGAPPPQMQLVPYHSSSTSITSTTASATVTNSSLSGSTHVPQHPYFSSHVHSQSASMSLSYPQHQPPHVQSQSQSQSQLSQPQQQPQPPLHLSNISRPEVSVPLSNTTSSAPDTAMATSTFTPISQNPPRSRSGSASPWPRGNGNFNPASTNTNGDGNASSSSASGGSGGAQNGFGSSALTYDSFWSGFKGSTTPNTTISLPASTSTLASTPGVTERRMRTRTHPDTGRGLTPDSGPLIMPASPPATTSPFDIDMNMGMSMGMGMNLGIGMDGGMNMGMMGMGIGVVDDTGGGDGGGSYGFGR